jgi:osmotically inducible protein OsmC
MIRRTAEAVWRGTGKDGKGLLTTQSGVLEETPYSFSTRFQSEKGTNPEELVGAAHAGCFSMALAFMLSGAGHAPEELRTSATVIIEEQGGGWTVTESRLTLMAKVPGLSDAEIQDFAEKAKAGCPISRLLNAKISLEIKPFAVEESRTQVA